MTTNPYIKNEIETLPKAKIVVKLYEAAVRNLKNAAEAIKNGDIERRSKCLSRTQEIVFELNLALDMENGGEISKNLRDLYNFMHRKLFFANINADLASVYEVLSLFGSLGQGFKAVAG